MPDQPETPPANTGKGGLLEPKWWQSLYELPPIGTATQDEGGFFADIRTRLAIEARNERDKWIGLRDASLCIFNYGEFPQPPDSKFIENFIQGDVIGAKSVMFSEPVAIEVGVEDDGSKTLAWFWNGPAQISTPPDPVTGQTQKIAVEHLGIPTPIQDAISGSMVAQPLDEEFAQQLIDMGFDKWVVAIDNKALADIYQLAHDKFARKCKFDNWVDQFVMSTLKGGWNTGLYQFDAELGHVLENIPVVNCFPDPTRQFVWVWEHSQIVWVLRLERAQQLYPEYAELLYQRSQLGQPKRVDSQSDMGYQYDRDFQSRTVTLSVTWMANQPKPMSVEEAIQNGHVEHVTVQDYLPAPLTNQATNAPATPVPAPTSQPNNQSSVTGTDAQADSSTPVSPTVSASPTVPGTPQPQDQSAQDQSQTQPPPPGNGSSPPQIPQPGAAAPIPAAQPFTETPAMALAGSDTIVDPTHPQWPMRSVLRQFTMLDELVISDDECAFPVMQIIHATCIPHEDTPYGFGLPWKMRHAQKADSIMANSIANNSRYYGNPAQWMDAKIKVRLKAETGEAFVDPGTAVSLEEGEYTQSGPKAGFFEIPELNQHHIEGRQQMQNDRKELGGYTDALKGVPVTSNTSGELQKVTMSAASGVIGAISNHLQGAITHLAELMLYSLTHYATVKQISDCCKRYRPEVIAAIHLMLAPQAAWKVDALLASGAGAQRQQKLDRLTKLNEQVGEASGMPIVDDETLQEALNLDPATIQERNLRAVKQRMQLTAPQQPDKPMESINFKDVPPIAGAQMLQQAGINASPEQLAQHQAQQQANQQAQKASQKPPTSANNKPNQPPDGTQPAQAA